MPLHHTMAAPVPHLHRLPVVSSSSSTNSAPPPPPPQGMAGGGARMAHHHHGIPMPPPPVMLSMPPPIPTGGVMNSHAPQMAPPPGGPHMHIQHVIHHQPPITRSINGNSEIHQHHQHHAGPPPPMSHHHGHHHHHQHHHHGGQQQLPQHQQFKPRAPKPPPVNKKQLQASDQQQQPLNKAIVSKRKAPPDKVTAAIAPNSGLNVNLGPQPLMAYTVAAPGSLVMTSTNANPATTTITSTTQVEDSSGPAKEKTPMCLINELARYNKIQHQYRLTDESGPAHKKTFTVCLKLGDVEEFNASGPSIKKAQHAAAAIALEKTSLKHPPPKSRLVKNTNVTPTVELNALAMKRGEPTVYTFLDTVRPQGQQIASGANALNYRGMYNQRYHQQFKGPSGTSPVFRVRLTVGSVEVTGEGSSAQAAKHSAATNALLKLKEIPMPSRSSPTTSTVMTSAAPPTSSGSTPMIKSNLNPASVPFVPKSSVMTSPSSTSSSSASSSTMAATHLSATIPAKAPKVSAAAAASSKHEQQNLADQIYSELKSPISLVHENALKRNMTVKFEVARETGPPHMRTFLTRCMVGDFVTEGEGNGKKTSKTRAAEMMLEKLRELPPLASCQPQPKKKSSNQSSSGSSSTVAKKKSKNLIKLDQKANPDYGQSINPISRLIQIQQARKQKEPVYTLIAERGMPRRREFVMQVSAAGQSAQGSGPNKKLAKRAAAEALLQLMGYSRPSLQPSKPALKGSNSNASTASSTCSSTMSASSITNGNGEKTKKLTFVDQVKAGDMRTNGQKEPLNSIPGILYLDASSTKKDGEVNHLSKSEGISVVTTSTKLTNGFNTPPLVADEEEDSKVLEPKEELQYLSQVLGFKVTYTDFPQKSASKKGATSSRAAPEYITLVKLSTKPPKVCHGKGSSQVASQSDAARRALILLADSAGDINEEEDIAATTDHPHHPAEAASAEESMQNGTSCEAGHSECSAVTSSSSSIPIVSAAENE